MVADIETAKDQIKQARKGIDKLKSELKKLEDEATETEVGAYAA